MKQIVFTIISSLLILSTQTGISQEKKPENFCGYTGIDPWLIEYQDNPSAFKPKSLGITYVPMTVHLVGKDNGSGVFPVSKTIDALCQLNKDFEPSEIQFYLARDFNYLNNSNWDEHDWGYGDELMNLNNFDNSVNLYVVGDPAGACGYFSSGNDGIAVKRSCSGPNEHTWAHEVGHFFSLPHTFSGWEGDEPDYKSPAPATINGRQVERTNGSNCRQAGDRFCDTPADYLSFRWSCNGEGQSYQLQMDPDSVPFRSDGTYFMSYSNDGCMDKFSPDQTAAMHTNLANRRRALINTQLPLAMIDSEKPIVQISPEPGAIVDVDEVYLSWEPVEHATGYIVDIARLPDMSLIVESAVVTSPEYLATKLLPGRNFYWRIRPYSEVFFCRYYSPIRAFRAESSTATDDFPAFDRIEVYPNPQASGSPVMLQIAAAEQVDFQIHISSLTGQILSTKMLSAYPGDNQFEISVPGLQAGLYLLSIENGSSKAYRKLMIK